MGMTPKMKRVEEALGVTLEETMRRIFSEHENMEAVAEELSRGSGESVSVAVAYQWAYRLGLTIKRELVPARGDQ